MTAHVVLLAVVGGIEAVVHLWRYRSANRRCPRSSALSAGAVQLLRVAGIGGVAASLDSGAWALPAFAYVVSPVVVTWWVHAGIVGDGREARFSGEGGHRSGTGATGTGATGGGGG